MWSRAVPSDVFDSPQATRTIVTCTMLGEGDRGRTSASAAIEPLIAIAISGS